VYHAAGEEGDAGIVAEALDIAEGRPVAVEDASDFSHATRRKGSSRTQVESAADDSNHRKFQAQASKEISLPRIIRVMQNCAEQLEIAFHNKPRLEMKPTGE